MRKLTKDEHDAIDAAMRKFADEGKLIEAGFAAFALVGEKTGMPASQIEELRCVYMAGAEHLFLSIMGILDPGEEPTAADMRRMDMINAEIMRWRDVFATKFGWVRRQ